LFLFSETFARSVAKEKWNFSHFYSLPDSWKGLIL